MLYAIILHTLAGILAGSLFKIRTLACLLILILIEAATLTTFGIHVAAIWIATNLAAIQSGYVAGIFGRWAAEQAGYSIPPVTIRRPQ